MHDDDDDDGVAQHGGHNRNEANLIYSGLIAELMKFFKERAWKRRVESKN